MNKIPNSKFQIPITSKGQSLLEVLVAMTAAIIVMTAISTAVIASLRNAQTSRNQNQAAQHAQEGMEYIRKARSQYYAQFESISHGAAVRCLAQGTENQVPTTALQPSGSCPTPNIDSTFIRTVRFDINPTNCNVPAGFTEDAVLVTVTVRWAEGRCGATTPYCAQTQQISCLTPYNVLPEL